MLSARDISISIEDGKSASMSTDSIFGYRPEEGLDIAYRRLVSAGPGNEIGLAIVKNIMERHGVRMRAEPISEKGS